MAVNRAVGAKVASAPSGDFCELVAVPHDKVLAIHDAVKVGIAPQVGPDDADVRILVGDPES